MDAQLKRGVLDACVLTALLRGDSYGYRIVRELSGHVEISESTLYPILRRLETGGMLVSHTSEQNGRLRKYYAITQGGRKRVEEFLADMRELRGIYDYIESEMSAGE